MRCNPLMPVLMMMAIAVAALSCSKKNDPGPGSFTIAFSNVDLASTNLIPSDTTTKAKASAILNVMGDSMLNYDVYFKSIPTGDAATTIALYSGSAVQAGNLLIQFSATFNATNEAVGSLKLPKQIIDSFVANAPMFVVVGSTKNPNGLVRGQAVGNKILYAVDVAMNGTNVVPSVTTTATGTGILRLLSDNVTFYSSVNITNLPVGDTLLSAAVRKTSTNAVVIQLASSSADFGKSISQTIASATGTSLQTDTLYVDVRSKKFPNGLIRGKIR
jgi:hypothetical protein